MTPLPLLCVVLATSWPALDASDAAIYRSIHEPRVVAPEVVAQGRKAGGVRAPQERQRGVFRERRHLHPHD